jgi:hypothetical protein
VVVHAIYHIVEFPFDPVQPMGVIVLDGAKGGEAFAHFTPHVLELARDAIESAPHVLKAAPYVLEAARDHRGQLIDGDAAGHMRSSYIAGRARQAASMRPGDQGRSASTTHST